MKKLSILLMSVLALGFAACDDYEEALPQSNPQQPLMSVDGLTLAAGEGLLNPIDLNTMEGDSILLVTATETPELNEGTYITYDAEIAADDQYKNAQRVALTDGKIAKNDLNSAFRAFYGKTPVAKDIYFRFIPYLTDGTSRVAFKKDLTMVQSNQKVTPIDLGIVVDSKYYVVTDLYGDWENSLIELSNGGEDQYENPIFTALVQLPAGEVSFMAESDKAKAKADVGNEYKYVWGTSMETSGNLSGSLIYGGDDANTVGVTISKAATYSVSINMVEHTYTIEEYVPTIIMNGQTGNFKMTLAQGNKYWFINYVDGGAGKGFNFTDEETGEDFGYAGTTFVSNVAGVSFAADGSNITVSKGGWYLFGVEKRADGSYVVNLFPANIYVYGSCNGGKWEDLADWTFTAPADATGDFVSPKLAADGELRLCVHPLNADGSGWIGDWWQSEFIFFDGKISYRGLGGDQARVNVSAGSTVYLNFINGTASVK